MHDYDAIIIGAGMAGLEAARRLAGRGHRVALVERKAKPDERVHTTGIFVRRTFAEYAFPPGTLGPPIRRVVLESPRKRSLVLTSERDEFRVGRMKALYRRWLEDGLGAGVEFFGDTRFIRASPERGGCVVWLERGGRSLRLRARVLVGADGARSKVAESLGLAQNREWLVGVEDVYEGAESSSPPSLFCVLDPVLAPGYIGWMVHDGESVHVGVGGYADRFEPRASLSRLHARLAGRLVNLTRARCIERRGGLIPVNGILERIGCANGLLIGDAAGAVSPLTAGGLDACVRLTAVAVEAIDCALSHGTTAPLELYSGKPYRPRFVSRRALRRALAAVSSPVLAELAVAFLRLPPFRALAQHVYFGRGSFPDAPVDEAKRRSRTAIPPGRSAREAVRRGAAP